MKQSEGGMQQPVNRRSFLKKGAMAAGAATAGAILLSQSLPAFGQDPGEDGRPLANRDRLAQVEIRTGSIPPLLSVWLTTKERLTA